MDQGIFHLLFLSVPFLCLTIMYVVLTIANRSTTGEIKFILPPEILLKIFAVFLLISVVFVLATSRIISESTVAALLGTIASGILGIGIDLSRKRRDEKKDEGR